MNIGIFACWWADMNHNVADVLEELGHEPLWCNDPNTSWCGTRIRAGITAGMMEEPQYKLVWWRNHDMSWYDEGTTIWAGMMEEPRYEQAWWRNYDMNWYDGADITVLAWCTGGTTIIAVTLLVWWRSHYVSWYDSGARWRNGVGWTEDRVWDCFRGFYFFGFAMDGSVPKLSGSAF